MKLECVAILSTGEMGHMIASALGKHGLKVITCLSGRSERTARLAAKAGVLDLPTLKDVVAQADMVISVVVPSAAHPLAQAVAKAMAGNKKPLFFADVNPISAKASVAIDRIITGAGGRYVDACIIGSSSQVGKGTIFYASGPYAGVFAELNHFGLEVEVLGDLTGQASAFKILYAGLSKGVSSLMLELMLLSHGLGIREQITARYKATFPDIVRFMEENLPSLPFRAKRRSEEMEALCQTIEEAGLTPIMAPASRRVLASVGELNLRMEYSEADEEKWDVESVVKLLYARLSNKA